MTFDVKELRQLQEGDVMILRTAFHREQVLLRFVGASPCFNPERGDGGSEHFRFTLCCPQDQTVIAMMGEVRIGLLFGVPQLIETAASVTALQLSKEPPEEFPFSLAFIAEGKGYPSDVEMWLEEVTECPAGDGRCHMLLMACGNPLYPVQVMKGENSGGTA